MTINLTGTIVDSDSQAWAQAIVTATLVGYSSPQGRPRDTGTGSLIDTVYQTVCADDGSFTLAVESNDTIGIPNTGYEITVQPNVTIDPTVVCSQKSFTADTDISSLINAAIVAPRFECLSFQRAYSEQEIVGPFQGAVYVNTAASASYSLWIYDGDSWIEIGGGGGGGGITGLNGDVLAGTSPFTDSTCVMVHAFDDEDSLFYIDTQIPATGSTHSVGLWAKNTFNTFSGAFEIYYDNDTLDQWILHFQDWGASASDSYIYTNDALTFISTISNAEQSFIFGIDYALTKGVLKLSYDGSEDIDGQVWGFDVYNNTVSPATLGLMLQSGGTVLAQELQSVDGTYPAFLGAFNGTNTSGPTMPTIPSASNIFQNLGFMQFISGTETIETIAPLTNSYGNEGASLCFVRALDTWSTNTSGNILNAITAVVGHTYIFFGDGVNYTIYDLDAIPATIPPPPSVTDETASRAFGVEYQNTTSQNMQVSGYGLTSISSTGTLTASIGAVSGARTTIYSNTNTASVSTGHAGFSFIVPPGYFYQVDDGGDITGVGLWTETLF